MSSNVLARLSVELAANTAAFQSDLGKAARVAEKELKGIGDAAMKMGGLLGAGIAAGASAFVVMAKQSINAADEMGELAEKVGVSTEKLSAYNYIAKMSGADTEAVGAAFKKLNVNVVDAARGQGAAKDAFAALGIELKDSNGKLKDSDTVMREVATRMSQFEDGATKTALATDIFGKAGADLVPMLNKGEVGFAALTKEAEQMGLILSTESANAAGEFNDSMDRMQSSIKGAVMQVVGQMLPTFNQLAGDMAKASMEGGVLTGIANGLGVAFKTMVTGGYTVAAVLEYIGTQAGMAGAALMAVLTGDFAGAKAILSDDTAEVQFGKRIEGIAALWDKTEVAATAAGVAGKAALGAVPSYAPGGKGKSKAGGKPKAEKDSFDYGSSGLKFGELDDLAESESASAAAFIERDKAKVQSALQTIQQGLMTKRQIEMQDLQQKQLVLQQSAQYELLTESEKLNSLAALERDHKLRIKALDDEELRNKQEAQGRTIDLVGKGLSAIAGKNKAAHAAAALIQNRVALKSIFTDTRAAAMGAYKAMVGIPYIGPALAVAAAGAAMAFGGAQAASLGGSIGGGASSGYSAGSAASTGSVASLDPREPPPSNNAATTGTTIWQIPEDSIMTARQIADWLDVVYASGKQPQNLRVMLT